MPAAVRADTQTAHGVEVSPTPGSGTVFIDDKRAWRALPAGAESLADATSGVADVMNATQLTPPEATAKLLAIQTQMLAAAGGAAGQVAATLSAMMSANASLTSAWTAMSAAPGGQAAATATYTRMLQTALAQAAASAVTAIAGGDDLGTCTAPGANPHGPGVFVTGSATVFIDGRRAVRASDKLIEAAGGPTDVSRASSVVFVDD